MHSQIIPDYFYELQITTVGSTPALYIPNWDTVITVVAESSWNSGMKLNSSN